MRAAGSLVLIAHLVSTGCTFEAALVGELDAGAIVGDHPGECDDVDPSCGATADPTVEVPVPAVDPPDQPVSTEPPEDPAVPVDDPPGDDPPVKDPPGDDPPPTDLDPPTDPPPDPIDPCAGPEICRNGVDDDCDWDTDCEDSDCADECAECFHECVPGTVRWCNSPDGCRWGQQQCNPDQTWGTCHETMDRPTGCEMFPKYDTACCDASAAACCEDWPFLGSVGECTGTVPCWDWP